MVVKDVHVLEFLSGQDFLFEQGANELIGESNNRIGNGLCDFQVNDGDFLALSTLVQPCEVINSRDLKRIFDKYALNALLMFLHYGCQFFSSGVMTQYEFEEREVG